MRSAICGKGWPSCASASPTPNGATELALRLVGRARGRLERYAQTGQPSYGLPLADIIGWIRNRKAWPTMQAPGWLINLFEAASQLPLLLVSNNSRMPRELRNVVFVDGVRTPFGKAGSIYAETRADDLVVHCIRELLRRHPELPPERIDDVAIAATTQTGDQGLTIGRTAAATGIPLGAWVRDRSDVRGRADRRHHDSLRHRLRRLRRRPCRRRGAWGHHPHGQDIDPNPRIVAEKLVDQSALIMGATAENLHDRFPGITKERADAFAALSQQRAASLRTRRDPGVTGQCRDPQFRSWLGAGGR